MSRLKTSHRRKKRYAVGDLNKRITLLKRVIVAPVYGSAAPSEDYDKGTNVWASVNTFELQASGQQLFDKVDLSEAVSHKFVIRYREFLNDGLTPVTKERVIRWKGNVYKILHIRNPEERNEYLELYSTLLGDKTKEANK